MARGGEAWLWPPGDLGRDAAAVGLVADDDHRFAAARHGSADVVRRRAGCQPVVRLRFYAEVLAELGAGLAGAQEGAREDRVRPDAFASEAFAELPCGAAALGREPPELVRFAGLGFRVADEMQLHSWSI